MEKREESKMEKKMKGFDKRIEKKVFSSETFD